MRDRLRRLLAVAILPLLVPSIGAAYRTINPVPTVTPHPAAASPTITSPSPSSGEAVQPKPEQHGARCAPCGGRHGRRIGSRRALPPVADNGSLPAPAALYAHEIGSPFGVGSFIGQRGPGLAGMLTGRLRLLGAGWVREEFTASVLHSGSGAPYHWAAFDRVVNRERAAGLQVLGLLDYSNTWGYRSHATMPRAGMRRLSADFARYAAAVVRHFRGRISRWEIWNEPNLKTFWRPAPDPAAYARLLTAAYGAIKRVDPHATVVIGGMSGVDLRFLHAVTARTKAFDAIAVHPYRVVPEDRLLRQIAALRRFGHPLWFTEIGWPAGNGCSVCTDEETQAGDLVRFFTLAAAAGVRHTFWYDLRDDPHAPGNPEGHFGLLHRDLAGKPAFAAYQVLAHALTDSRFVGADALDRVGVYALRFGTAGGTVVPMWNTASTDRQVSLRWIAPAADILSLEGEVVESVTPRNGRVTIRLAAGSDPVYLVSAPLTPVSVPGALLHPVHRSMPARTHGPVQRVRSVRHIQRRRSRWAVRRVTQVARAASVARTQPAAAPESPASTNREQGVRIRPVSTPTSAPGPTATASPPIPLPSSTPVPETVPAASAPPPPTIPEPTASPSPDAGTPSPEPSGSTTP
jgi:hypothetical protein